MSRSVPAGDSAYPADTVLRLKSDVRFRPVGNEGVAVKQTEGEIVVISEVGAMVMGLIDGQRSLEQIVDAVYAEYEVAADTLAEDVQSFVGELIDNGIAEAGF